MGVLWTRSLLIMHVVAWVMAGTALAQADEGDLYQGQTIVTGQRVETRLPGLAKCLIQVLVKVSGDPRLAADPAVEKLAATANDYVAKLRYHDRMAGMPLHDEQGTRDRPYDLTVDFDEDKINTALHSLGREPWPAERPRLLVLVSVKNGGDGFILTSNGPHGVDQRDALMTAAEKIALPILLPSEGALKGALETKTITLAKLGTPDMAALNADARALGTSLALVGTMVWSDKTLGWDVNWHLTTKDATYSWTIDGVSFDDGFRTGVAGAAQALSGHAENGRVMNGL